MPKLSVWLVRASMIQMGIGFLFGAMILHHKGIPIYDWTWKLLNPYIELMIFGWTMQFVMGVAFLHCHVFLVGKAAMGLFIWDGRVSFYSTLALL